MRNVIILEAKISGVSSELYNPQTESKLYLKHNHKLGGLNRNHVNKRSSGGSLFLDWPATEED